MFRKSFPAGASMRELVTAVAGPRLDTDTRESWLRRASRLAGVSYRQTKAVWYGELTDPYHRSISKLREAAGRHEARNLASQFESLANSLNAKDEDFYRAHAAALVEIASILRGLDSTGNYEKWLKQNGDPYRSNF